MKAFSHGGHLKQFSKQFQIPEKQILDFSSNVTPFGLPESARKIYPELIDQLTAYPDPDAYDLRAEVARHFPLFPENVIAGNGSMDLLALAIRALAPKRALLVEPCFSEYRRLLNLQGAQIKSVVLKEGERYGFLFKEIQGSLPSTDFVIIGHPNNPTGTAFKREELLELLADCRRRNIFVVVDEAFADWTPEISVAKEIKDNSFFFVTRSLTKFYGLAGLRAGYGLGSRRLIETLETNQSPWSMNTASQQLSIAALRDKDFRTESLGWFQEESRDFYQKLKKIPGFRVFPSLANFFLMKIALPQVGAESLFQFCGQNGIYIRLLRDFPGLGAAYFRIALRSREENQKLLQVFQKWAEQIPVSAASAL
jgi:threonine-phosphate decarboxylase